jgi:hypothetical protein
MAADTELQTLARDLAVHMKWMHSCLADHHQHDDLADYHWHREAQALLERAQQLLNH